MLRLLFTLLILLYSESVFATPSVSNLYGSLANSSNFTIIGTTFGSAPTIYKWDNFESGVSGNAISGWTLPDDDPIYSNIGQRTNSTLSSYSNDDADDMLHLEASPTTEAYVTFWIKIDLPTDTTGMLEKIFRLVRNALPIEEPDICITCQAGGCGTVVEGETGYITDDPTDRSIGIISDSTWERFEIYAKSSTPFDGTQRGEFYIYYQQGGEGNVISLVSSDAATTTNQSGNTNEWHGILFFNYGAYPCWIDDTYFASSQARVEIGSGSTVFANCTHREIQIPTSWSDGSITFTVNQGSFGSTDNAYLFVIDSDGNASDGYPVTFGQSYGGSAFTGGGFSGGTLR